MTKYNKKSLGKLIEASDKLEEDLASIRLRHSQGKLRDTAQIRKTKRELARVNTAISLNASEATNE